MKISDACFFYSIEYIGDDPRKPTITKSALKCQEFCQEHSTCQFFTFESDSTIENCKLKKDDTKRQISFKDKTASNLVISGPQYCQNRNYYSVSIRCNLVPLNLYIDQV